MPTSTNVTNLKINQLTEAQYDTAVQQGIIGENELSILTDAEAGQVIQVATLPTASADELGNIYQFVGTTDANYTNGYFYKCVSDGATPAVYSWEAVEVQASSGSSYTAGTGIDITGGVISVADPVLVNNATGANGVAIKGQLTNSSYGVVIGASNHQDCIIIGRVRTNSTGRNTIVLNSTNDTITYADLGSGEQSAFYVKTNTTTGAVKLMSADGRVPSDRVSPVTTISTATVVQALSDQYVYNCGEMTSVEVTLPATIPVNFTAQLNFTSGTTPTTFISPVGMVWLGDDCTLTAFVPEASKRYAILFFYDGVQVRGIVQAV